jgi:hypothetical protein
MTSANVIAVFVDCKSIVPVRQGFGYYPALDEDHSSATMPALFGGLFYSISQYAIAYKKTNRSKVYAKAYNINYPIL